MQRERERERERKKGGGGGGGVPGNSPGAYMQVPIQNEEVAIETINMHHSTWYDNHPSPHVTWEGYGS